jgi:phosphomannomutase/phosphoglucomutase
LSVNSPSLLKFWSSLLLVVVPSVMVAGLYFAVLNPWVNSGAAQLKADTAVKIQAGAIDNSLQLLSHQLEGLSRLTSLHMALSMGDQAELDNMADDWATMFSHLNQLVILPLGDLGTADLGAYKHKLRNNIEKNMVERARGDQHVVVDVYRLNGEYVVSLARAVKVGNRSVGAIMLTLKADWVFAQFDLLKGRDQLSSDTVTTLFYSIPNAKPAAIPSDLSRPSSQRAVATASQPLRIIPSVSLEYSLFKSPAILGVLSPVIVSALLLIVALGLLALRKQITATGKMVDGDANLLRGYVRQSFDQVGKLPSFAFTEIEQAARDFAQALEDYRAKRALAKKTAGPELAAIAVEEPSDHDSGPQPAESAWPAEMAQPDAQAAGLDLGMPLIPAHVFRAYDIRGIAETELDDDIVELVGKAIGTAALQAGSDTLVVGRDGRLSSARIHEALISSLLATGCDVVDIGLVPTPLVYFAIEHLQTQAGVMITGSHNSPDVNGFKVVLNGQALADKQIQDLYALAVSGKFATGAGDLTRQDFVDRYIDQIADDVVFASPIKVVLDCGNGAASDIAPMLFASLGCEVVPLFAEVDGNFPNHLPDPCKPENIQALVAEVMRQEADLGLAFDGDADRVVAVTGSGRVVDADLLLMLFAKDVLTRNPGADVVYDVKCTRNLSQVISSQGGRPVMWQSGHSRIKQKMFEIGALLGGEFSGHFCFKERWLGFDDGLYSGTRLIEILTLEGLSLDAALAELPSSVCTPEIDILVEEGAKFNIIEELAASTLLVGGEASQLDGLRVDYAQGWGLVRASNTSSKLTARFEADSEAELQKIQQTFAAALAEIDPTLKLVGQA